MARTALCLLCFVAVVLIVACGGGEPAIPPPEIKEAHAERDVVDGAAQLKSTVAVTFDRDFTLAASKVKLESHFELEVPPLVGSGPGTRVLVKKAERSTANPRVVTLSVDALLTTGSTVKVARAAFQDGATGQTTATVSGAMNPAMAVLASTALQASKPAVVANAQTAAVTPEDRDPAAMRAALAAVMDRRRASDDTKQAALKRYDAIPAETAPSPKLRAALAALTGTFAEAALDSLFTSANCTNRPVSMIAFQSPPGAPGLLGRSTRQRDGSRVISLNPLLEGERIELLLSIVAHEAIHCDGADGRIEEVAATAFDTFLYLSQLPTDPQLALGGTVLARELNIDAIAMINSGRRFPESIGILKSIGVNRVLPGTNSSATAFADVVVAAYPEITTNDSPEEALAKAYADAIARQAKANPVAPFNLRDLDELLGAAMPPDVLANDIVTLGLTVGS